MQSVCNAGQSKAGRIPVVDLAVVGTTKTSLLADRPSYTALPRN